MQVESKQIQYTTSFEELVSTPFRGTVNALCWTRELKGDFSEIVENAEGIESITELSETDLLNLELSEQGQLARSVILEDLRLLSELGASPVLNLIRSYQKDESFFPTDVYSFHVDRSPVAVDTYLCTYYGDSSEILPNDQAEQKVLVPEIREELQNLHQAADEDFQSFLSEHSFDLHYRAKKNAHPVTTGTGNLWKLAVDHPESIVPPCIHRAPNENSGKTRLLLIC